MAAYYVTAQGSSKGHIHRLGGAIGGVSATCAGWRGAVNVRLRDKDGISWATVTLGRWNSAGIDRTLYDGPVDAKGKPASFVKVKKAKA